MFKKYLGFIVVFFLLIIPLFDLFHPGLPITHDGQDHVARIAKFYQSLTEGNIVPRWAGNLNWGYGHPILMFLYPLPSYFASAFHFLGFSLIDSVKVVFGISFIASGVAMYLWMRNVLGELPGIFAGVLYMFAPYRFVDLYVRGAIGEHVAFVFIPLVLYFLLKLSKEYSYRNIVGGSFSFAALILSHNAITLMFVPFILFYGFYLAFHSKNPKSILLCLLFILLLGFGLASFFIIPAYFEGKYTLRDIVTKGEYASRFVQLSEFISTQWSYGGTNELSKQIGIVQIIGVIGSLLMVHRLFKKERKIAVLLIGTFIYFFLSIFLMLEQSKLVWQIFTTLQKFQFPWRFSSVVVFTSAVLGAFLPFELISIQRHSPGRSRSATPIRLSSRPKPSRWPNGLLEGGVIVLGFIFLVLWFNKDYWHAKGYLYKPDSFFKGVYYGTTDTGESSPIWSVRFMEREPKAHISVIDKSASITELARSSTYHRYRIVASNDKVRIKENTLYFPGWKVLADGKEVIPEFQDPQNRGLMTFFVDRGIHDVEVKFGETKLRQVSNLISLGSIILLIIVGYSRFWQSSVKDQISTSKAQSIPQVVRP